MISESVRVATLKSYDILDTPEEPAFDLVASAMAACFGVRSAIVSFIDEDRQWYKARHGVAAVSVPRASSFCTHFLGTDAVTVIPDARQHDGLRTNPFVLALDGVRFYAAAPIKALNRARIGTVCIFDPEPRPGGLTEREKRQLSSYAAQVVELLERHRSAVRSHSRGLAVQRAAMIRAEMPRPA